MVSGRRAWAAGPGAEQEPSTAAPHAGGWQPTGCYSAVDGGAVLLSIGHLHPKRNMQRARMVKWRAWAASDKEKDMYSSGSPEENVLSVTFCKPLLWIRTALHNPVWANSTRELSPSPAPALQPCLPQSPPQPACFWLLCRTQSWCCCTQKLSPTSTSHPTVNIVQALSSDLKDVVHTGAAIAETTVASCMAWVPLVWSCTALQAKWMLCSSFHSTAAALHNTGLTNPKANQGQHSRQETFPTTTMCSGTSFSPAAAVLGNAVRQKTEPRIGMCVTKTTSEGRAEVRGKRCDTPTRAAAEMG